MTDFNSQEETVHNIGKSKEKMKKTVEEQLHKIIDEIHPLFTPISDEECIDESTTFGTFVRMFLHENGNKYRMKWHVYYGTPKTVKTIFEPAEIIS